MEGYRAFDTPTTKNSGRITFAYIVIEDKLEIPDSSKHQGVWEKLAGYAYTTSPCNSLPSIKNFYQSGTCPVKSLSVLMLMFMGHHDGFQKVSFDLIG